MNIANFTLSIEFNEPDAASPEYIPALMQNILAGLNRQRVESFLAAANAKGYTTRISLFNEDNEIFMWIGDNSHWQFREDL